MAFIGAAISAISAAVTASGVGAFLTKTVVGRLLVSVASSALIQALTTKKQRPPGIKTDVTQTGGTVPQSFVLGLYATAGTMVCPPMSHGSAGGTPNAYLTYVIDLGDIAGLEVSRIILNDEYVTLGAVAHPDYGLPVEGTYAGRAWVKLYDGSQTAADPMLLAKYGTYPERPWSTDMIGRGVPHAILTFRYDAKVWRGGLPTCRFEVTGLPLYDIRADSTAGGSGPQRWSDPSTWAVTDNPFVMIWNILRGIALPDGSTWGGGIEAADLDLASFSAAMNACDASAPTNAGGTEAQFRAGLEVGVDEQPADVIAELLKAASGQLAEIGGIWKARAGGPGLPVFFLTDDDVIVTEPSDLTPFPGLERSYNGIHASYPDPEQLWESKEAPPVYDAALEAEDQGRRLIADLSLPAVPYPDQVQRLMTAYLAEERRFARHSLTLPPSAAVLEPLDALAWTSDVNGYDAKVFEVAEITDDLVTGLQRVALRERDAADYSYPVDLFQPVTTGSTVVVPPGAQVLPGWTVTATVIADDGATARRPALKLAWDGSDLPDVFGIQWEVRVLATGVVCASGIASDIEAGELIVSAAILPNVTYEARALMRVDRPVDWTGWASATTADIRIGAIDITVNGLTLDLFANGVLQTALYPIDVEKIASTDLAWSPKHAGLMQVFVIGGAGSGGVATKESLRCIGATGGGAGGMAIGFVPNAQLTDVFEATIGAGGAAVSRSTPGATSGNDGSLSRFVRSGVIDLLASPGQGGGAYLTTFQDGTVVAGGAGGAASGGTYNRTGGRGGHATISANYARIATVGGVISFDFPDGVINGTDDSGTGSSQTGRLAIPTARLAREVSGVPFAGDSIFSSADAPRLETSSGSVTQTAGASGPGCGGSAAVASAQGGSATATSAAGGNGVIFVVYYGQGNLK